MPKPRSATVFPGTIQILHVFCRVVRRAFLMGFDSLTGRNFDHRRDWILDRIKLLAQVYCIDVNTVSIMHNHYHLQVRTRPDLGERLTDEEVVRRLLLLEYDRYFFPDGRDRKSVQREINLRTNDAQRMKADRERLSDISKYMQSLNQHIARKANQETNETGTFFEKRFGHELLEDEADILTNALYIDSNPIHAEIASTPEEAEYTGAFERINDLRQQLACGSETAEFGRKSNACDGSAAVERDSNQVRSALSIGSIDPAEIHAWERGGKGPSGFLSPVEIDELNDPIGPDPDPGGRRPSRKGFLSLSVLDYLVLLDFTGRRLRQDRRGSIPSHLPPILDRLGVRFDKLVGSVSSLLAQHGCYFESTERGGRPDGENDRQTGSAQVQPAAS